MLVFAIFSMNGILATLATAAALDGVPLMATFALAPATRAWMRPGSVHAVSQTA